MSKDDMPFGEDITHPDARTIPTSFHGAWAFGGKHVETIAADTIQVRVDTYKVVAVRFIDGPSQVAIVASSPEGEYALFYRGLHEDGAQIVDLESTDWVLERC